MEDKILQRAVVAVLNAIYEEDFRGFAYGFRPKRSPHDALDALMVGISRKQVNWILDLDVRDFFGTVSHEWRIRFLEQRIGDERILRLIRKWLKAGVLECEAGEVTESEAGTPQVQAWLPPPRLLHPWPAQRFDVKHPRWEPSA